MGDKQTRILTLIGLIVIAIIILPIIFAVSGSIYSLSFNRPMPVPSTNPLTVSEEAKWELHQNEEYGFSVPYPSELYLADKPFNGYIATFLISDLKEVMDAGFPDDIAPRIQIFSTNTPIEEFKNQLNEARNKDQFPEFSKIEVKNYEAYQTKALDSEVIFTHTIIGDEERSYLIELFTIEKENDALKEIYERMLQSFQIL